MSQLKADSELETIRFWQAVYINFTKKHGIPDPCGNKMGYKRIIACFIKQLMMDHNSQSTTVHGYVKSINTLFKLCKFDTPADLTNRANICSKIILAREKEESVAQQRSPITHKIYSMLLDQTRKSPVDSPKTIVVDWFTLIRITGLHCAEYAQKTQTSYDKHEYPSGKRVIKAFIPNNWKFYNSKGRLVTDPIEIPKKLKMTFQIKKTDIMANPLPWWLTKITKTYARSRPPIVST
jgi:hypothetical protein